MHFQPWKLTKSFRQNLWNRVTRRQLRQFGHFSSRKWNWRHYWCPCFVATTKGACISSGRTTFLSQQRKKHPTILSNNSYTMKFFLIVVVMTAVVLVTFSFVDGKRSTNFWCIFKYLRLYFLFINAIVTMTAFIYFFSLSLCLSPPSSS